MKSSSLVVAFFLFSSVIWSQKIDNSLFLTNENLKENANSIVMEQHIEITINSHKSYTIKKHKVIRVLNELGVNNINAIEHYDSSTRIKSMDATMYNAFGKTIKAFKQKDFKDQSVADGFSVLTDDRMVFLDFTPTEYPFTIVYDSEVVDDNTAFIPSWIPISHLFQSVLKSSITLNYVDGLGFKFKEQNFSGYTIIKKEEKNKLSYTIENAQAIKYEELSPSYSKIMPKVNFGLERFSLEGVEGTAKTWKEFGLWRYNTMLADNEVVPEETLQKVKSLIGDETNPIEKAKIIYKYVQDKTRYVSVQLGIGGWKPMLAKDVDRLGYGDCKALTNYTRVLLKAIGVESFYTVVYGDRDKMSFETDFVSMQGNHIILALPNNGGLTFLECTSQTSPFGFQGDFTDDRYALIVKPDGGEIVKTNSYIDKDNCQKTNSSYTVLADGSITCNLEVKSTGIAYDNSYLIEKETPEKIKEHYKEILGNLLNLTIEKYSFVNDKNKVEFTEKIDCKATNYAVVNNNTMIFPLNAFNQFSKVPQRYRTRNNPFEIARGFFDEDEIQITLPENYTIDAKPNTIEINDKYGNYKAEITVVSPTKLIYKRSFLLKKGLYDKTEYDTFRKFIEQIAKADNSKIVLIKNP
jgi:Domain of Unknown Function with PDB structure (DUF3857)